MTEIFFILVFFTQYFQIRDIIENSCKERNLLKAILKLRLKYTLHVYAMLTISTKEILYYTSS